MLSSMSWIWPNWALPACSLPQLIGPQGPRQTLLDRGPAEGAQVTVGLLLQANEAALKVLMAENGLEPLLEQAIAAAVARS